MLFHANIYTCFLFLLAEFLLIYIIVLKLKFENHFDYISFCFSTWSNEFFPKLECVNRLKSESIEEWTRERNYTKCTSSFKKWKYKILFIYRPPRIKGCSAYSMVTVLDAVFVYRIHKNVFIAWQNTLFHTIPRYNLLWWLRLSKIWLSMHNTGMRGIQTPVPQLSIKD